MVAIAPFSSRVRVTLTSDWKPFAEAVNASAAGISTSATETPMAALAASTTALEVTVAPASASMPSPRSGVAFLPMNWFRKASSSAQRVPRPAVSPEASTAMPVITPASTVRVTVTSLWKPCALPVLLSPAASSSAGNRLFTASITALEVTVAPASTSTVTGAVLPMNWFRKASSSAQRVPKPSVSLAESTAMVAIAPFSSRVTVTLTSDWKPFAEAVNAPSGRGSAAVSAAGSPVSEPKGTASGLAGAATAAFTASTTAVEVTGAPESASMFSPMAKGAVLPTNCSAKAGSSMQRVPKLGVSPEDSMARPVIAPSPSMVSCTFTSEAKPRALPSWISPTRAICSTGFFSATPKTSTGSARSMPSTPLTALRAVLEAFSTAVEVTVAPDRASIAPPSFRSMPANCSACFASSQREPKPEVSAKVVSPIFAPVTLPSMSTPRVTATGPA